MTEQDHDEKPHGDPLLASAQGRNDGDDGSRHGKPSPPPAPDQPGAESETDTQNTD